MNIRKLEIAYEVLLEIEKCVDKAISQLEALEAQELASVALESDRWKDAA